MNFEMQIANLLAENIIGFVQFVYKSHRNKSSFILNLDKLYQVILLVEEFKLQILADELQRINQFSWNEKYTYLLVERFRKGLDIIDEYIERNYEDLFILTARLHTLKSISLLLKKEE
ncbi:hypothetical protein CVD28_23765 [Bacillus sp. M6-12]|uniref:hypothetical protein n=1 Tax=Bacillus sp. M6-12 TaxID=2054166 RepID=UPI000C769766|nr:hypothetical protein [Bacillus sp. M6-12]PLS15344.1 hypothetical protein CVD28_23765 [Bacillus sp. M6-12]